MAPQVPAAVQAVEHANQTTGPYGDLECLPQVRRGVAGAALLLIQERHLRQ
jgi:hypothetical protein